MWQTLTDKLGNLHIIYSNKTGGLSYAKLENDNWSYTNIDSSLSEQSFSIFEVRGKEIFVLYNDGKLVNITDIDNPKKVTEISAPQLYFLQTPRHIPTDIVQAIWLSGSYPNNAIQHARFSSSNYFP